MGQWHRHELSDAEWRRLEPLLPPPQTGGRPYHDHRRILNGMLWILHTGAPWRDLPERYGPWRTVYSRFRRWSRVGLWDRVLAALQRELDAANQIEWTLWAIDSSSIRAHKAAAGGGKKPARRRAGRPRAGA
jgi:transposase